MTEEPSPRPSRRRGLPRMSDLLDVTEEMIAFADKYQQAWENEAKATIALGEFLNFRAASLKNQVELMRLGNDAFRRYNEWSEALFGVRPETFMRGMLDQIDRLPTVAAVSVDVDAGRALKALLGRGGPVTATGPTWQFEAVAVAPLPARPGGPPIWMASFAPSQPLDWTDTFPPLTERQLQRVGRLADGWVPLVYSAAHKRRLGADALAAAWRVVLDSADRHGRSRQDIDFVYADWCFVLDGPGAEERCRAALARFFSGTWEDALRTYTIGTADEVLDRIREHTRAVDSVDGYILTPLGDDVDQLALLSGVADSLRAGRPS